MGVAEGYWGVQGAGRGESVPRRHLVPEGLTCEGMRRATQVGPTLCSASGLYRVTAQEPLNNQLRNSKPNAVGILVFFFFFCHFKLFFPFIS